MIHFTKEVDYGLVLMTSLAENPKGKYVSLKEIARKKNLPYRFLGKIVAPLKKIGIVESEQGIKGGYRLAKKPTEITVANILAAYSEDLAPVQCLQKNRRGCKRQNTCETKSFWNDMYKKMEEVAEKYSVSDFLEGTNAQ